MRRCSVRWSDVLLSGLLVGCGDPVTEPPSGLSTSSAVDCETRTLSWDNAGGPVLIGWCAPCHASGLPADQRQGAPVGVDFDTLAASRPFGDRIVERAVTSLDMPPGGPLTDADQLLLLDWVSCGMP